MYIICMYLCIYTDTCTYIYECMYITYICIYIYICVSMYICVYTYVHAGKMPDKKPEHSLHPGIFGVGKGGLGLGLRV